ncbi:hypothetical protein AYO38_06785 [bacterium SCGC AG-212-C10]|nr:hypothetical protein AYO38_06785 [bacterium SCGC AG-212-C10]
MLDLTGKAAVVTGAGSGIGRGVATALARAGATVACSDVLLERAEETAAMIVANGGRAIANAADVRDRDALERLANETVAAFGRLDICVANAGIGRGGGVLTMTEEDWDLTNDVNAKGVFLTTQACAREMVRQDNGGRIILIASIAAERAQPAASAYCASKAAVRMMGRCWALELAPFGITVNSIGPGVIDTPLGSGLLGEGDQRSLNERVIPAGRAGVPVDIGNLACWLASDEAEYVSGTYQIMDGGLVDAGGWLISPIENPGMQPIRDARRAMGGKALLDLLDQQTAEAAAMMDDLHKARGLQ